MRPHSADSQNPDPGDPGTVTHIRERVRNISGGANMELFIVVLLAMDIVIVTALLATTSIRQAAWVVPIVVGAPLIVFWIITFLMWKPWERRFPAMPQSTDAIVKQGQSVSFGRLGNMNNCMTLAADAHHLHLIPFAPMRMVGAKVISIPWDRFTEIGPPPRLKIGLTRGVIDGRRRFAAPEWAMGVGRAGDAVSSIESIH